MDGPFVHRAIFPRLIAHLRAWASWLALVVILAAAGCGAPSLPRPPVAPQTSADYVAVPFAPRVPPVEFIPPSPSKNAVWVDGSWAWSGNRWGWRFGTWVVPPAGARFARWVVIRRKEDGQIFFAPSSWRDASGKIIEDRRWRNALGPRARARSRPGASAPTSVGGDEETDAVPEPPPVDTGESED